MKIFGTISELVKVVFRLSGGKELRLEVSDTQTGAGPVVVTIPNVGSNSANLVTTGDTGTVTSAMIAAETITDGDISLAANISRSKVAAGTTGHVLINDPSTGVLSSEAQLAKTRGGTGISSTATFPASGVIATHSDKLNAFASTTSAEFANPGTGVISDATGSGGQLVLSTSPNITTPTLGSISSLSYDKVNVTISSNTVTASAPFARLTGTAANVQTVNLSGGNSDGAVLVLTNECSPAAEVTIVNSTGNVLTGTGEDFVLKANAAVTLIYDNTSTKWKLTGGAGAGGGATTDKISAVGLDLGDVVALDNTGYIKARTDVSSTAEVVGIVTKVISANVEYEITLLGEVAVEPSDFVNNIGTPLVVTPTGGTVIFASNVVAGKLTTWEPSTLGHVSVPVGIMLPTTSKMYFLPKRGTVVGGTNARTQLNLTSNSPTQIFNAASPTLYSAGELTGWVQLGTSQRFYFKAPFAQNGAGTDWNVSPSYVGDTPPAGFSITMANTGVITATCPTFSGIGLINYALNAPAVGATFPLAVDAGSLTTGTVSAARLPNIDTATLTNTGITGVTGTAATTAYTSGSGKVGEVIDAGVYSTTTATTTEADVQNSGATGAYQLTLTAGIWLMQYSVSAYYQTATTAGANGYLQVCVTDSSNTHISKSERIVASGSANGTQSLIVESSLSASFVLNVTTSTTYKMRLKKADGLGTGTAKVERSAGNYDGNFYAVRIA